MRYAEASGKLGDFRRRIDVLRGEMRRLQAEIEPEDVRDYTFQTPRGERKLSGLFDGKADLFVIHNMGAKCPYCTLWADGYNGLYPHIADRAAFYVSSPDAPEAQRRFAESRGWRFPMISHQDSTFAADMGYRGKEGGWLPGVSAFQRKGGKVVRVADTGLRPRDDYCALWHFFDLLPAGADGWEPRFQYS